MIIILSSQFRNLDKCFAKPWRELRILVFVVFQRLPVLQTLVLVVFFAVKNKYDP